MILSLNVEFPRGISKYAQAFPNDNGIPLGRCPVGVGIVIGLANSFPICNLSCARFRLFCPFHRMN